MSRVLMLHKQLARHMRIAEMRGKTLIECATLKEAQSLKAMFYTFFKYLDRVEKKPAHKRVMDDLDGMLELIPLRKNISCKTYKTDTGQGVLVLEYKNLDALKEHLERSARKNEAGMMHTREELEKMVGQDISEAMWNNGMEEFAEPTEEEKAKIAEANKMTVPDPDESQLITSEERWAQNNPNKSRYARNKEYRGKKQQLFNRAEDED